MKSPQTNLDELSAAATSCNGRECGVKRDHGIGRRNFLFATAASVTSLALGELFPGRVLAQDASTAAQLATFPAVRLGKLGGLRDDVPQTCFYPSEDTANSDVLLIKLGRRAGGGIGPDQDVVAFSALCTHMGGAVDGYSTQHKLGGCSQHLTTFDLTRHGMVVAGHATESLPQIVLELRDDDVYAVGIIGLLYGHYQSPS